MPANLVVAGQVVPDPGTGAPRLMLSFQYGYTQTSLIVDDQAAQQMCDVIPRILKQGIEQIRRARSGLIVPTPDDIRASGLRMPPNGQPR